MPTPKDDFEATYPCEFYTAAELLEPDLMYTIPEIARLLQGVDPDEPLDEGTETVLIDWAIPWVMNNADDLVIAEPLADDGPGYYGLADAAIDGDDAAESERTGDSTDDER
ncbi:hypothetical protein SAMN05192561_10947 [Halopenitus malekzadehii]|uniref:Uncharacterized protein n=1 Tax=Halopenitus malekzadehii TaxID=1267564 RepID=A0A1H6JHD2_9EURY|nr:DUF5827 family protein [Halopenitus malekzadehii]SEH58345.1 hypothetical protein SAMN05192561_10947 [Halopenitus malekzadehii]